MKNLGKENKKWIKELNKYSYEYYTLDNPSVTDKQYDEKYDELLKLEKETNYVLQNSPTKTIGNKTLEVFKKHKHNSKLWSMDKVKSIESLKQWHERNVNFINEMRNKGIDLPDIEYVITKKFDGLTINLTYEDQLLSVVATRGTGLIGENVTEQVKTIKSIPNKINYNKPIDIHGEALMTQESFEYYNAHNKTPLKNLRNGAAGALRNLNVKETAKRNLIAYFYDIGYIEGKTFNSYIEMMNFIKELGLPIDDYLCLCKSFDEVIKQIEYLKDIRFKLNYDIDGVVIAINDIKTRELLGNTIKFPKWEIAYKFEAQETTTKLLGIEWNVGRTGKISPVGILEPVNIGGITVKRATLNNIDDIKRKGVRIGAEVFLRRSNDVIPEITGVVKDSLDGTIEIKMPKKCPACDSELVQDGVNYFCENTLSCKPQLIKSIVHYCSREAMNIDGFSDKTAEQLFEELNIKSIDELYSITINDLINLERFGKKKAENLLENIQNSKHCELSSFLYALGIPNVGIKTSKDLEKEFKSFDNIINAKFNDLIKIQDIGDNTANNIIKFFNNKNILKTINKLLKYGVNPIYKNIDINYNTVFNDKTIVITGSLNDYSRNELKQKLENLGAKISSSVSKKTDYVIVGDNPGSKYNKAIELGIKILNENDLNSLLSQYL